MPCCKICLLFCHTKIPVGWFHSFCRAGQILRKRARKRFEQKESYFSDLCNLRIITSESPTQGPASVILVVDYGNWTNDCLASPRQRYNFF